MNKIYLFLLVLTIFKISPYEISLKYNQKELRENNFISDPSRRVYVEAERTVETFTKSLYNYSTTVNTTTGVFEVDCSSFISYVLAMTIYKWYEKIYAHSVLTRYPQRRNNPPINRCLAKDFFEFFYKHNNKSDKFKGWEIIGDPRNIKPGDVIAIKYASGDDNTGHVLIAADYPITHNNIVTEVNTEIDGAGTTPLGSNHTEYAVKIIDSSASPHGDATPNDGEVYYPDSRVDNPKNELKDGKHSGIGRGYICIGMKNSDPGKIAYYKRSVYGGSYAYFMPEQGKDAAITRDMRIGRPVEYDDNPAYYSNYYGVNVENISVYKNLDIAPTDDDPAMTRENIIIRSSTE